MEKIHKKGTFFFTASLTHQFIAGLPCYAPPLQGRPIGRRPHLAPPPRLGVHILDSCFAGGAAQLAGAASGVCWVVFAPEGRVACRGAGPWRRPSSPRPPAAAPRRPAGGGGPPRWGGPLPWGGGGGEDAGGLLVEVVMVVEMVIS